MKTTFKTIKELVDNESVSPLPLEVIPNKMGINLCNVDGLSWTSMPDGQLVNVTIHFKPNLKSDKIYNAQSGEVVIDGDGNK